MKQLVPSIILALTLILPPMAHSATPQKESYGKTADGEAVDAYTLTNSHGLKARLITYGATLIELHVPDRDGKLADVVLGCDNIEGYQKQTYYFGCIVGRVANRIAQGKFLLESKQYTLATNNATNHLHGGLKGFDKRVWKAEPVKNSKGEAVRFIYTSPDGEEGYPGTLQVAVTYILTEKNALEIDYEATTDKTTIVNLTHHSYFNLAGTGDILEQELQLHASHYTPVDATSIPTGEIAPVAGTPFDFTKSKLVGKDIAAVGGKPGGYDHNWALDKPISGGLSEAAELYDPKSGRLMRISTTDPGIQFYSGNFLDGTFKGKGGKPCEIHAGLCLETQHFPDSINHPNFPPIVLHPAEKFSSTIIHQFSIR
jgi:aldose 1-epimerase